MEIRPLTENDIPAAVALSTQAGWNQTPVDWKRLLLLAPYGCFGGWVGPQLVATSTALCYGGALCWIGMVLVHRQHRRRGFGRLIFEHALAQAQADGVAGIGLDATDLGQPLYRQYQFADVFPVTRWGGLLQPAQNPPDVDLLVDGELEELMRCDLRACGLDRGMLLRQLLSEQDGIGLLRRDAQGEICAYALVRPGRTAWQLGPVVAHGAADLEAVLAAAASRMAGAPVVLDAVSEPWPGSAEVLLRSGLKPRRHFMRMLRGMQSHRLAGEAVVAASGLELG